MLECNKMASTLSYSYLYSWTVCRVPGSVLTRWRPWWWTVQWRSVTWSPSKSVNRPPSSSLSSTQSRSVSRSRKKSAPRPRSTRESNWLPTSRSGASNLRKSHQDSSSRRQISAGWGTGNSVSINTMKYCFLFLVIYLFIYLFIYLVMWRKKIC